MKRILVTGANGFIGTALCKKLLSEKCLITAALRRNSTPRLPRSIRTVRIGGIDDTTDWAMALDRIDTVIHLAARVHVMAEDAPNALDAYRKVNVQGTRKLAVDAAKAGVRRIVFLSSVKVNGEQTQSAFREEDQPLPEDDYGISKLEGENELKNIADKSGTEIVVIRPPLVYGPEVKANFLALMRLIDRKIPLPLANIMNRRSFIFLDNLVDAILHCMNHPAAAGQTYLVSDDTDVSTPELVKSIAAAMNRPVILFPFPEQWLYFIGRLLGKKQTIDRLCRSLTVDISKIKNDLSWTPPFDIEFGLRKTALWYRQNQ